MTPERYADFLARLGHHVSFVARTWWFDPSAGVLQAFPFHRPLPVDAAGARAALGARWFAAKFTCADGTGRRSYKIACADRSYAMKSLTSKARNQTRRGLEKCTVRQLGFDDFEALGDEPLELFKSTLRRQKRRIRATHDEHWRRYWALAGEYDGFEAWGAFCGDRLAAVLIACTIESCVNIFILRSHADLLDQYPNNALVFRFTEAALARPGVDEVSFGLESLIDRRGTLDHFKIGLGYLNVPLNQAIVLRPAAAALLHRRVAGRLLVGAARRWPTSESLGKLAGVVTWHAEQSPPRALVAAEETRP